MNKQKNTHHRKKFKELEEVIWPEPTGEEIEAIIEEMQKEDNLQKGVVEAIVKKVKKVVEAIIKKMKKEDNLQEEVVRELVESRATIIREVRKRIFAELQAKLKGKEAVTDTLTGLKNRGGFDVRMEAAIATAERYNEPFSLIMIDIDHFKQFNDKHGHSMGDIVLREVARILQKEVRQTDMVARYGGEEFVVILEKTDIKNAEVAAKKLRQAIEEQTKHQTYPPVTISAGFAEFSQKDENLNTAEAVKDSADKALYHAKEQGRNKIVSYEKNMTMPEDDKLTNEIDKPADRSSQLEDELNYKKEIFELVKTYEPKLAERIQKEIDEIEQEINRIKK